MTEFPGETQQTDTCLFTPEMQPMTDQSTNITKVDPSMCDSVQKPESRSQLHNSSTGRSVLSGCLSWAEPPAGSSLCGLCFS